MSATATRSAVAVESLEVSAYEIPTEEPESDGTLEWDSTTIVVVEAHAGDRTGLGYTYGPAAARALVAEKLAPVVEGADALKVPQAWGAVHRAPRHARTRRARAPARGRAGGARARGGGGAAARGAAAPGAGMHGAPRSAGPPAGGAMAPSAAAAGGPIAPGRAVRALRSAGCIAAHACGTF